MKKEEIEIVIGAYLDQAKDISFKFGSGNYGNNSFIQQFVDGIQQLVAPKNLIECKTEIFNEFIIELLEIQKRINELKEGEI